MVPGDIRGVMVWEIYFFHEIFDKEVYLGCFIKGYDILSFLVCQVIRKAAQSLVEKCVYTESNL